MAIANWKQQKVSTSFPAIRDGPLGLSKTKKLSLRYQYQNILNGLVAQWQSLAHADYALRL